MMQVLDCQWGVWNACATVEEMAHDKLMAVIKVWDKDDSEKICSRHTLVFDQQKDGNALEQTQAKMQELLTRRYRI